MKKVISIIVVTALVLLSTSGCAPKLGYITSTKTITADCGGQPGTVVYLQTEARGIRYHADTTLATITLVDSQVRTDGTVRTKGTFGDVWVFDGNPGTDAKAFVEGRLDCAPR